MTWVSALTWIRRIEGGYVDDPHDRGGATYAGVSLRAVVKLDRDKDGRLDFDLDGDGDVDAADIKALKDHPGKVGEFYRAAYYGPVGAAECPWPMSIRAFDAAVHHGVGAAVGMIQRALGVEADGVLGPRTQGAMREATREDFRRFDLERLDLFHRICMRRGDPFFRGWASRLLLLQREADG